MSPGATGATAFFMSQPLVELLTQGPADFQYGAAVAGPSALAPLSTSTCVVPDAGVPGGAQMMMSQEI